jgi:WD40 repeat protein
LGNGFSPSVAVNNTFLCGGEDDVTVYDLTAENQTQEKYTLTDMNNPVNSLGITKTTEANYLIAGTEEGSSSNGKVFVWNLSDGSVVYNYEVQDGRSIIVSIGPDNFRYIKTSRGSQIADTFVERSLVDGSVQKQFDLPSSYRSVVASDF